MGLGKALQHVFDDKRRIVDDSLHKIETLLAESEREALAAWDKSVRDLKHRSAGVVKIRVFRG
jgi:hypothetical protein